MNRKEAIEYGEAEINSLKQTYKKRQQPLVFGESAKALLTLLSTTRQVEEVIRKIKGSIILEQIIKSQEGKAVIDALNEILTLLTEEDKPAKLPHCSGCKEASEEER